MSTICQGFSNFSGFYASFGIGQITVTTSSIRVKGNKAQKDFDITLVIDIVMVV